MTSFFLSFMAILHLLKRLKVGNFLKAATMHFGGFSLFLGGRVRPCGRPKWEGVWPLRPKMQTRGGRGSEKANFLRTS